MSLAKRLNQLSKDGKDFEKMFINAMDLAIKDQNPPRVSRANIKPSKAGCLRQMYYILSSFPVTRKDTVNPNMSLIQQEGTKMHTVIQEILFNAEEQGIRFIPPQEEVKKAQEMGIKTEVRASKHDSEDPYEVTCYNSEYDVSFKFDGTVVFRNKKAILEIKNEDHFKFLKRRAYDPEHLQQVVFYSICIGINYVLFLYVGRNYKDRKAYLIEITQEMKDKVIMDIKIAHYCTAKSIIPGKTDHKGCQYCSHKSLCKRDGDITHIGKVSSEDLDSFWKERAN